MGSLGPFLGDTHTVSLYLNECKEVGITYEHLVKEKPWRDLNTRIRVLELSGRQYAAVTRVLARKKYNYLHVDFLSCNHMKLTYYLKENLVFFGFSPYVTI